MVSDRQGSPVAARELAKLAGLTLAAEGRDEGELSLSFVTPREMAELHLRYLDEPGPTDVLSFPMDEEGLIGDVIVCPEQASLSNRDLDEELRLLVVHGVLHLLGYDHQDESDRAKMWERQQEYSGVSL